jgi:hypothetical protein
MPVASEKYFDGGFWSEISGQENYRQIELIVLTVFFEPLSRSCHPDKSPASNGPALSCGGFGNGHRYGAMNAGVSAFDRNGRKRTPDWR